MVPRTDQLEGDKEKLKKYSQELKKQHSHGYYNIPSNYFIYPCWLKRDGVVEAVPFPKLFGTIFEALAFAVLIDLAINNDKLNLSPQAGDDLIWQLHFSHKSRVKIQIDSQLEVIKVYVDNDFVVLQIPEFIFDQWCSIFMPIFNDVANFLDYKNLKDPLTTLNNVFPFQTRQQLGEIFNFIGHRCFYEGLLIGIGENKDDSKMAGAVAILNSKNGKQWPWLIKEQSNETIECGCSRNGSEIIQSYSFKPKKHGIKYEYVPKSNLQPSNNPVRIPEGQRGNSCCWNFCCNLFKFLIVVFMMVFVLVSCVDPSLDYKNGNF